MPPWDSTPISSGYSKLKIQSFSFSTALLRVMNKMPALPQKITIMTSGSRGDIQPYIAAAITLKSANYSIRLVTNCNFKEFVESSGITCVPCFADAEHAMSTDLRESMGNGKVLVFLDGLNKFFGKKNEEQWDNFAAEIKASPPDLLIEGTLTYTFALACVYILEIPTMTLRLQAISTSSGRMIWGMPSFPCGLHNMIIKHVIVGGLYDGVQSADPFIEKHFGTKLTNVVKKKQWIEDWFNPPYPSFVAQSPIFGKILNPEVSPAYIFCGACVVSAEQQRKIAVTSGEGTTRNNFGNDETQKNILAFIKQGTQPVYMGWGSMMSRTAEQHTLLAVKAAMESCQRAILLGGYAGLSTTALEIATKDIKVLSYAQENILFIKTAPHEWLFPLVSCVVHHGGAGTLNACTRSGVPNIITPVFLDQYDHAYMINKLEVGIGFDKQLQEITSTELADAITKVTANNAMAANAKALGEKLRAEDGDSHIVANVEKFWTEQVCSGKQLTIAKRLTTRSSSWCGCS